MTRVSPAAPPLGFVQVTEERLLDGIRGHKGGGDNPHEASRPVALHLGHTSVSPGSFKKQQCPDLTPRLWCHWSGGDQGGFFVSFSNECPRDANGHPGVSASALGPSQPLQHPDEGTEAPEGAGWASVTNRLRTLRSPSSPCWEEDVGLGAPVHLSSLRACGSAHGRGSEHNGDSGCPENPVFWGSPF